MRYLIQSLFNTSAYGDDFKSFDRRPPTEKKTKKHNEVSLGHMAVGG
jgi:hypothetical protein